MSPLPTASNTPSHTRRRENWAPAYIFIGVIPLAFIVAAVASVLLRRWHKKRQATGGRREDGQQPQDIELTNLRRHWFPWREAAQEVEGNVPSSSTAGVAVGQSTQQQQQQQRQRQPVEQPIEQPIAVERQFGVNPRLANKLAAKFERRGGVWGSSVVEPTVAGPSRVRDDDDKDARSSVTQWPGPGMTEEPVQKPESKPEPRDRAPPPQTFCHGYGARRESDVDRERYAQMDQERHAEMDQEIEQERHAELDRIQTEGMAEVDLGEADLGDGVGPEERQRQEAERRRIMWRERILSLTRDDDLVPLVRQNARESQGKSPRRGLAKIFSFKRGRGGVEL